MHLVDANVLSPTMRGLRKYYLSYKVALKKNLKSILLFTVCFLLVLSLFSHSEKFQQCIKLHKKDVRYQSIYEGGRIITRLIARAKLHGDCGLGDGNTWIVPSGLFVAAFTFTLWMSTEKLWKASSDQLHASVKSVNAINKQIAISIAQESPSIFPMILDEDVGYKDLRRTIFPDVSYKFHNFGRTPAIIRRYYATISKGQSIDLINKNDTIEFTTSEPVVSGGKKTDPLTAVPTEPYSAADRADIWYGVTNVWFWGYVVYDDVFNTERTRRFVYCYDHSLDRFVEYEGKSRNFQTTQPSS